MNQQTFPAGRFETAFEDAERAAQSAVKAAAALTGTAKLLQKAAQTGDVGMLRRSSEKLQAASYTARQEIANAISVWPFSPEQEEEILRSGFEDELISAGRAAGLEIRRTDDRLFAFPYVVRVLPKENAVQVNRKKITGIRPTNLVKILQANSNARPKWSPERFIESLFGAYTLVLGTRRPGSTVHLAGVYKAFTLLPGSAAEYSPTDFSRDIFFLDRSGVTRTKSGARLALPAATGTKGGAKTFTAVTPDGSLVVYYGISFSDPAQ